MTTTEIRPGTEQALAYAAGRAARARAEADRLAAERDRLIYQLVVVERASIYRAHKVSGMSRPAVTYIVRRHIAERATEEIPA